MDETSWQMCDSYDAVLFAVMIRYPNVPATNPFSEWSPLHDAYEIACEAEAVSLACRRRLLAANN